MSEAVKLNPGYAVPHTPAAAVTAGEVLQLSDGRAAIAPSDIEASVLGSVDVCGCYDVTKAADVVILNGAPIWWDHSANAATPVPQLGDRDFYLGMAQEDAAGTATVFKVQLNARPSYISGIGVGAVPFSGGGDTAIVLTAGTPYAHNRGEMLEMAFSATAEAQKVDWLARRGCTQASNPIVEMLIEVTTSPDNAAVDADFGLASGTHATDFESIAEFVSVHLDGNDNNIDVQSDDGTTDVTIVDSTIDWAAGTAFYVAIDCRDPSDCQVYINGVLVLGASTFTLAAATGTLRLIAHMEKTSDDSPGVVQFQGGMRIAQQ